MKADNNNYDDADVVKVHLYCFPNSIVLHNIRVIVCKILLHPSQTLCSRSKFILTPLRLRHPCRHWLHLPWRVLPCNYPA